MKYFIDTEFIEDGVTIDLMSIALVREDGEYLYRVSNQCDLSKANDFVKKNVMPNLFGSKMNMKEILLNREQIKKDVLSFIGKDKPEFWGYYADYDWVAFCQLFGKMIDLPKDYPMYCRDFKQVLDAYDIDKKKLVSEDAKYIEHNALSDAFELMEMFFNLEALKAMAKVPVHGDKHE